MLHMVKVFGKAFLLRVSMKVGFAIVASRLNLFKAFKKLALGDVFKSLFFALGTTSISALFTITRALIRLSLSIFGIQRTETLELLFGGAVASVGIRFFARNDLPTIKTVVYMRAIQSSFILLRQKLAFM